MPRKIDNARYRRFRNKGLPLYQSESVTRDDVLDLPEILDFVKQDLLARFVRRLRARHAFDKKRWEVELHQDFDIDYNRVKIVVKQRFLPIIRKKEL